MISRNTDKRAFRRRMTRSKMTDVISVKLSAQTRLLRAGMYALSVAISFWVSHGRKRGWQLERAEDAPGDRAS